MNEPIETSAKKMQFM